MGIDHGLFVGINENLKCSGNTYLTCPCSALVGQKCIDVQDPVYKNNFKMYWKNCRPIPFGWASERKDVLMSTKEIIRIDLSN